MAQAEEPAPFLWLVYATEYNMVDNGITEVIEQLTLHKLEFTRQVLKEAKLPHSGDRHVIRERLSKAVDDERIPYNVLQKLLHDLDLWGQQRVRWATIPLSCLVDYQTPEAIHKKAVDAGLGNLFFGEMLLVPPSDMTPMTISYSDNNNERILRLMSAKTQLVREEQKGLEPIKDVAHPGILYYPFIERSQKVVAFAEINLDNGQVLISATLIRQGIRFVADFAGFFNCFSSFFSFEHSSRGNLYQANRIIHELHTNEIQLAKRRTRTSSGGVVSCDAHSPKADIRTDTELGLTHQALPDAPSVFSDCHWEMCPDLVERVHTHIYGPDGEVSILGKVKEKSARYVLRRIYDINF